MHRSWRSSGLQRAAAAIALWLAAGLVGCASTLPAGPKPVSQAIDPALPTALSRLFAAPAARQPGRSGFKVVATGHAAFVARAELAAASERTLDLQYYSADDTAASNLLLLKIAAAAQRGVRVRILLDDIDPTSRLFGRRAMALHPGIDVRVFNPFFWGASGAARLLEFTFDAGRLNRRMHNKLWIADNAAALIGSRNLGDEYFDAGTASNFADVELFVAGPLVARFSVAFDAYWNSVSAVPLRALDAGELPDAGSVRDWLASRVDACDDTPRCAWLHEEGLLTGFSAGTDALDWAEATFVWDDPDSDKQPPGSGLEHDSPQDRPGGVHPRDELLIVSPYFIPGEHGREHLAAMRADGIRIAVLTNSLASTDSPAAHAGYARHRAAMLRDGVELYETRPSPGQPHARWHRWGHASPSSLHAKMVVQDRRRAIVGSFNQDPRSRLHNTEAWVAVDSAAIAADLAALFDEGTAPEHAFRVELVDPGGGTALQWHTEDDGRPVRHDDEPMATPWLRAWRRLLGVLIPEHML